jgi:hypothetical protein
LSISFATSNFAEISSKIIWNTNVRKILDQKKFKKNYKKNGWRREPRLPEGHGSRVGPVGR